MSISITLTVFIHHKIVTRDRKVMVINKNSKS